MANQHHIEILKKGAAYWNSWRETATEVPDLSGADLDGAHLVGYNLKKADLRGTMLRRADLSTSTLRWGNLHGATVCEGILQHANLSGSNLYKTDLGHSNLTEANLMQARMVETDLNHADLTGAAVFGVSPWKVNLEGAVQKDLRITDEGEPTITLDNLEVAQFIYLLLNNAKIRSVIDTITSKVVLILGRFTPERKAVLDAFRSVLRGRNFLPVLFDFTGPTSRDLTETVSTLAHMARFIIADVTDAKCIPQELQAVVPTLAVPVQPVIEEQQSAWAMFSDFQKYPWVLPTRIYRKNEDIHAFLSDTIIESVTAKAQELRGNRQKADADHATNPP